MNRRTYLLAAITVSFSLACATSGGTLATNPSPDLAATGAAATLAGLSSIGPAGAVMTPGPSGDTPAPPSTPSTLRVAYIKGGNVWLWTDSSGTRQLTSLGMDRDVRISDDGQVIAFRRGGELWAVNSEGGADRAVVSSSYLQGLTPPEGGQVLVSSLKFVPHTHRLFFNTGVQGEAFFVPSYDLQGVDANAPVPAQYAAADQGGLPVFSPDGSMALLQTYEKVSVINADGTGLRGVYTFPLVSTYSESFYVPQLAWMNDMGGFKIVIPPADSLGHPGDTTKLYYVALAGGTAQVAEFLAAPIFVSQPQLSPDSDRVAFMRPAGDNLELHVIDSSGADSLYTYYAKDHFGLLGWTPDSQGFVYWTDDVRHPSLAHLGAPGQILGDLPYAAGVRWVDPARFLFLNGGELRLRALGLPSLLIDTGLTSADYDFAH